MIISTDIVLWHYLELPWVYPVFVDQLLLDYNNLYLSITLPLHYQTNNNKNSLHKQKPPQVNSFMVEGIE